MFKFIKHTITFLSIFFFILLSIFIIINDSYRINYNKLDLNYLLKFKSKHFNTHLKNYERINLILGSSFIEDSIIPDSLGEKWFSFTNQGQNIFQSFKILNLYKDLVIIDSILIELSPLDFKSNFSISSTLNKNYEIQFPLIDKLKLLEKLKSNTYFNLNKLFQNREVNKLSFNFQDIEYAVWSEQGFSGQFNRPNEQLYPSNPDLHSYYYKNVIYPINLDGFEVFNTFTSELGIKVFYILSPKSKNYNDKFILNKNTLIWKTILDSIESHNVEIFNYEKMDTDSFNFNFFYDEAHLTYQGAKTFTKIIKSRLKYLQN